MQVAQNSNEEKLIALKAMGQFGYGSLEGWCCTLTDAKTGYKWTYRLAQRHKGAAKPVWMRRRWVKETQQLITECFRKTHGYSAENPPPEVMAYIESGGKGRACLKRSLARNA